MSDTISKQFFPCPVCDGNDTSVLYKPWLQVDDPKKLYGAASGIRGTQHLVKCKQCEMIFENPRFPEDVILDGYKRSEEGGHDSQYYMRVNSFYRAICRLKSELPQPGARILDIGTAGGAFLDAAKRFGYDAYGLEPSAYLVENAKERGLQVLQGTIDDHPYQEGTFDMICLWDVIEHLFDPANALRKIRKLLKPDGILFINYPDIGTMQAKFAGKRFWWILSVHLHHFSRKTMKTILKNTGYEPFHFSRYWQILQFGYLEQIAAQLRVPLAALIYRLTPDVIRNIPIPYYASQTSSISRVQKEKSK